MNKNKENRHMIDVLFVITLFCLFAVCAMILIAVGAKVYKNTINHMETHFTSHTTMSYITEKVRQGDSINAISIDDYHGQEALKISQEINGVIYDSYIYSYDGYLKELFTREDLTLEPSAGQNILPINSFHITTLGKQLYQISFTDKKQQHCSFIVGTKCDSN